MGHNISLTAIRPNLIRHKRHSTVELADGFNDHAEPIRTIGPAVKEAGSQLAHAAEPWTLGSDWLPILQNAFRGNSAILIAMNSDLAQYARLAAVQSSKSFASCFEISECGRPRPQQ